jgi:hypothetical protein
MAGFTKSQMRAQLANLGIAPTTKSSARVAGDQSYALGVYGTSLRGTVRKAFVGARFAAQEQEVTIDAKKEELAAGRQTIGDIYKTFQSGAQAESAAFARAEALQFQEQTAASDSQTAAFAQQVYMANLQHRWAIQDQKRAENAALGAASAEAQAQVSGIINNAPNIVASIAKVKQVGAAGAAEDLTGQELYESWITESGIDPASVEAQYGHQVINQQSLTGGTLIDANSSVLMTNYAAAPGAVGKGGWLQPTIDAATKGFVSTAREAQTNHAISGGDPAAVPFGSEVPTGQLPRGEAETTINYDPVTGKRTTTTTPAAPGTGLKAVAGHPGYFSDPAGGYFKKDFVTGTITRVKTLPPSFWGGQ